MSEITVKVHGRGVVRGEAPTQDAATDATCDNCGEQKTQVASLAAGYACADCLRARLDALSVARYVMRDPTPGGLPWGKISG